MARFLDAIKTWVAKPHSLWDASKQGDTVAVLRFLDQGSLINQKWEGSTPLMIAAVYARIEVVRILLDRAADINPSIRWDWDSFACAVAGGNAGIVQMFVDRGANIYARDPEYKITSLMDAARTGSIEIVSLLLDRGMEINAEDSERRTALTYAREYGHADVVELLIHRGGEETEDWKE